MMIPVNVYAESTPNPSAMKFVCSMMLLEEGSVEYLNPEECNTCPMARQLFAFSGVRSIFISSNFITVTKESNVDWFEISGIIREFIRGYLMSGESVFTGEISKAPLKSETVMHDNFTAKTVTDGDTETEIIKLLHDYVRPAVEQDGGAIEFRSFHNGVVTVTLKGSCSGCPSSTMTLKSGIENLLRQMVPGVTEVVAEAE